MGPFNSPRAHGSGSTEVLTGGGETTQGTGLPAADQRQVAEYICEMILELRSMAKATRLHKIMVPLEFAYYEAFAVAHAVEVPPEEDERLDRLEREAKALESGDGS